jgi:hypothetical protein
MSTESKEEVSERVKARLQEIADEIHEEVGKLAGEKVARFCVVCYSKDISDAERNLMYVNALAQGDDLDFVVDSTSAYEQIEKKSTESLQLILVGFLSEVVKDIEIERKVFKIFSTAVNEERSLFSQIAKMII